MLDVWSRRRLIVTRPSARARWPQRSGGCRVRRRRGTWRCPGRGRRCAGPRTGAGRGWPRRVAASSCPRPGCRPRPPSSGPSPCGTGRGAGSRTAGSPRRSSMMSRSPRSRSCRSGRSAMIRNANDSRRTVVSSPPGEQVRGQQRDVVDLRRRPVREGGRGHRGHDVVAASGGDPRCTPNCS